MLDLQLAVSPIETESPDEPADEPAGPPHWIEEEVLLPPGRYAVRYAALGTETALAVESSGFGDERTLRLPEPAVTEGMGYVAGGACAGGDMPPYLLAWKPSITLKSVKGWSCSTTVTTMPCL